MDQFNQAPAPTQDEFDTLNNSMTISNFAITGGILPLYGTKLKTILFIRALYISPSQAITAGATVTLGVLPVGSRPASTQYFGGVFTNASGTPFGFRAWIATDGTISAVFEKAIATSASLFGTIPVILA